jgi:AcrR family transcriptional regulator
MPRAAFERLPEGRREQILETAAREFAAHGYERASLNHILAAAGVSKGAAYYYFEDKADLFATTVGHHLDHVIAEAALDVARLERDTFWVRIAGLYRNLAAHGVEKPFLVGLAKATWRLSGRERGGRALAAVSDRVRELVGALVARGQEIGVVRRDVPPALVVEILLAVGGAVDAWIVERIDRVPGPDLSSTGARVLEMVKALLAPPGGAP